MDPAPPSTSSEAYDPTQAGVDDKSYYYYYYASEHGAQPTYEQMYQNAMNQHYYSYPNGVNNYNAYPMYTNNAYPSSNDGYTYNNNNNIMNNTTTSNGSAESQVQFSLAKKKSLNPPLNGFDQGNGSQSVQPAVSPPPSAARDKELKKQEYERSRERELEKQKEREKEERERREKEREREKARERDRIREQERKEKDRRDREREQIEKDRKERDRQHRLRQREITPPRRKAPPARSFYQFADTKKRSRSRSVSPSRSRTRSPSRTKSPSRTSSSSGGSQKRSRPSSVEGEKGGDRSGEKGEKGEKKGERDERDGETKRTRVDLSPSPGQSPYSFFAVETNQSIEELHKDGTWSGDIIREQQDVFHHLSSVWQKNQTIFLLFARPKGSFVALFRMTSDLSTKIIMPREEKKASIAFTVGVSLLCDCILPTNVSRPVLDKYFRVEHSLAIKKLHEKDGMEIITAFQQKGNLGPLPHLSPLGVTIKKEPGPVSAPVPVPTAPAQTHTRERHSDQQPQTIPTNLKSPSANQVVPSLGQSILSPDQAVSHQELLQQQFHQLELPSSLQNLLSSLPQFRDSSSSILNLSSSSIPDSPKATPNSPTVSSSHTHTTPTTTTTTTTTTSTSNPVPKRRPSKPAPNVYDLTMSPVRADNQDSEMRARLLMEYYKTTLKKEEPVAPTTRAPIFIDLDDDFRVHIPKPVITNPFLDNADIYDFVTTKTELVSPSPVAATQPVTPPALVPSNSQMSSPAPSQSTQQPAPPSPAPSQSTHQPTPPTVPTAKVDSNPPKSQSPSGLTPSATSVDQTSAISAPGKSEPTTPSSSTQSSTVRATSVPSSNADKSASTTHAPVVSNPVLVAEKAVSASVPLSQETATLPNNVEIHQQSIPKDEVTSDSTKNANAKPRTQPSAEAPKPPTIQKSAGETKKQVAEPASSANKPVPQQKPPMEKAAVAKDKPTGKLAKPTEKVNAKNPAKVSNAKPAAKVAANPPSKPVEPVKKFAPKEKHIPKPPIQNAAKTNEQKQGTTGKPGAPNGVLTQENKKENALPKPQETVPKSDSGVSTKLSGITAAASTPPASVSTTSLTPTTSSTTTTSAASPPMDSFSTPPQTSRLPRRKATPTAIFLDELMKATE